MQARGPLRGASALAAWIEAGTDVAQDRRRQHLLERNELQSLSRAMRKLLAALDRYDFSGMLRAPGPWARLTGRDVLEEVQFRVAHKEVAELMACAQRCADTQLAWAPQWHVMQEQHAAFVHGLAERIGAATQTLASAPLAGRERLAHELQNARVVLASARLTAQQFELLRGQHDAILRRFDDIKHKLMPVWMDQMTALLHGRALDAGHLRAAVRAYAALSERLKTELNTTRVSAGKAS